MIRKVLLLTLLLASIPIQATTVQLLQDELKITNQELSDAIYQESKYKGGLIKTLIKSRVEILKINSALIQQRIHAVESGAIVKIHIDSVKPDPIRVKEIEAEIFTLMADIRKKEVEADKYTDGLIKGLLKSGIATLENSIAILRLELIKARYGITWIPEFNTPDVVSGKSIVKDLNSIVDVSAPAKSVLSKKDDSYNLIKPTLLNKRFEDEIWDKNIWFDILWTPINLKKDTRAVKGVLIFEDIFGEEKFRIRKTINDSIGLESGLMEFGIGFEYNDFKDSHRWIRSTDFEDMKFKFKVEDIIYKENVDKNIKNKSMKKHSLKEEIQAEEDKEREIALEDNLNKLKVSYMNRIQSKVRDKWRYNKGIPDHWGCDVHILQDFNGKVKMVNIQSCNIDNSTKGKAFKYAIERAVYKASPLPKAPDESVFNREILFHFRVN